MTGDKKDMIAGLIEAMNKSSGFAGLGSSIRTISSLGDDLDGGTRQLTEAILRDAALTSKLLLISNSSRNARVGRQVSTIDQALLVLGVNTVKSVALSLALLDSLSRKPQSNQLHAEIVTAYFCGTLAGELTRTNAPRYSAQEAQVCGLMQNLGRMMATYYLYERIEQSRRLQAEKNLTEDEAVQQTLGIGFAEIGAAIAEHWTLPDVIQNSLSPEAGKTLPRTVTTALAWHQLCACFCRQMTDVLFRLPENREKIEITNLLDTFRLPLHLNDKEARELIDRCLVETDNVLSEIAFPCNVEQARNLLRKANERVQDLLSSGDSLTKESNRIEGKTPLEIIQQILRLVHNHLDFDHTLICVPEGTSGLLAIAGVGKNASKVTSRFRCYGQKPDLFRVIVSRKTDVYVGDAQSPAYARLLPDWYAELMEARSFAVLPLLYGDTLVGVLYGDYLEARSRPLSIFSQGEMNDWRAQLVMALRSGKV